MFLQSWIIDYLKIFKISGEVRVYREYHGKLESGTDSRPKGLNWDENQERDLPGRCAVRITIYYYADATQSHA